MNTSVFEIVGGTPPVPGVAEGKVCDACDGEGKLEADDRSIFDCHVCNGTGGTDPEAVQRAQKFSRAYAHALGLEMP